jgi:hypothetical protein
MTTLKPKNSEGLDRITKRALLDGINVLPIHWPLIQSNKYSKKNPTSRLVA